MRKLKEVLRLHSLGLSQHQIARSCSISQSTVHEFLSAAQAAGVKWPAPEYWDDQRIERTLFPQRPAPAIWRKHPEPDWTQIHQELQTHKDLTLQLVSFALVSSYDICDTGDFSSFLHVVRSTRDLGNGGG